jgi:hypothetical protein
MAYMTISEFVSVYLPERIRMEAGGNVRKWCREWGVSYQYTHNILHGKSVSVSPDFVEKIKCRYMIETKG